MNTHFLHFIRFFEMDILNSFFYPCKNFKKKFFLINISSKCNFAVDIEFIRNLFDELFCHNLTNIDIENSINKFCMLMQSDFATLQKLNQKIDHIISNKPIVCESIYKNCIECKNPLGVIKKKVLLFFRSTRLKGIALKNIAVTAI